MQTAHGSGAEGTHCGCGVGAATLAGVTPGAPCRQLAPGTEFVLQEAAPPLFLVRRQYRPAVAEPQPRIDGVYYILDGSVYQVPSPFPSSPPHHHPH